MSQDSYDPNTPRQQPVDGGFSAGHSAETMTNPPPAPRRRWLWILFGVFGLGTLGLVICCGVGAMYFSQLSSLFLEPIRGELNQLTQVQTRSGEIEQLSMNFAGTRKEADNQPEFVILDAIAEKGSFQFSVKMKVDGSIDEAFLILEDGNREELDLSSRAAENSTDSRPSDSPRRLPPRSESPSADSPGSDDADPEVLDETERELRRLESELNLD